MRQREGRGTQKDLGLSVHVCPLGDQELRYLNLVVVGGPMQG